MGLLDFLFGAKKAIDSKQPSSRVTSKNHVTFLDKFIEIPEFDFFGQFRRSHSGEWVICWSDSDEQNHRGGYRDSGYGRYVLYNATKNTVTLEGRVERPNSGSVADNGNFSIEDWHFGSELSGTFYVFSSVGHKLIKKKFQANLYNSAISNSGRFAVCQTANAPTGKDGNRFTAFDVERNIELFSVHPPTGWADKYTFLEDTSQFGVVINGIGTFYYDAQGNLIDPEKFEMARLHCDRYDLVLLVAEDIVKSPNLNDELANEVLEASGRALSLGAEKDQSWKAIAFKIQGLAHERLRHDEAAIAAFDAALLINPKIGVKRKADSLRKKLARNERLP
ncbi:hypothetical protein LH442_01790 [Laribacter hongkongensis]|uniref:hypothetical protein n=1 Tax=Laribacter hongkongensis TaxID=168471 RepID=UPI001EFC5A5F|nr:hypothetical protein [Laribacter hongkongensis]MCG9054733.1 hypothetical protein [Laribacter hongkongensis]